MKKLRLLRLIFSSIIFTSCQFNLVQAPVGNNLSSNNIFFDTETDNNSEETDQFILKGRIEIEGAVPSLLNGQNNDSQNYFSKTAMPAKPAEIIYKFTMRNSANSIIGDAGGIAKQSEGGAYEISISPRTRKLDVVGYACATEPECATGNRILKGSANITGDDIEAGNTVDVVVSPYPTGTGTVNLNIVPNAPSLSNGYMVAKWTVEGSPKTCTVPTNGNLIFYLTESRSSEPVDCGVYEVEFSFYNSDDVLKYRCTEKINVFPNMETNTWVGGGSVHISNGIMDINSTCIDIYDRHEFFVSGSPVSGGTGTYFDPVTIPEAVNFVTSLNDGQEYTIYLKDNIALAAGYFEWPMQSGGVLPESYYISLNPTSNLKLKFTSYGNPGIPNTLNINRTSTFPGGLMQIGDKANVTLENICFSGGLISSGTGAGIYNSGTLTLENKASVTNCNLDSGCGGGIWSNGKLTLKSGSQVYGNGTSTTTLNGGGVYISGGTFNMEEGSSIHNNKALTGAAVYVCADAIATIDGGEIYSNESSVTCAGIYLIGTAIVNNLKLYSNTAKRGPAFNLMSNASLTVGGNTEIKDNTSIQYNGGAINMSGGSIILKDNVKFSNNSAAAGKTGNAIYMASNSDTNSPSLTIQDNVTFDISPKIQDIFIYRSDTSCNNDFKIGDLTGTAGSQTMNLILKNYSAGDQIVTALPGTDLSACTGNFVVLDTSYVATTMYIDSDGKLAGGPAGPAGAGVNFTPKTAEEIAAGGYISTYSASNSFSPGDKITCSSVEQLAIISEMSHAGKRFEGVEILLTDSIDVGAATITLPMFTAVYPFNGTFDGNGNSITGFGITGNGFFDGTLNATIKNLKLEGSVSADSTNAVGGLIGTAYGDTTIENCELTVNVTTTKDNVGGIVGNAIKFASTDNFIVRNCINNSEVSGGINVGGIAGAVGDYASVVIENCLNNGNITSTNFGSGIVSSIGSSDSTIKNCVNTGSITGTGSVGISASLAGSTAASVQNCFNLTTASSNLFLGATIYDTDSCVAVDYYNSTLAIKSSVSNAQGTYPVNTDVAEILNDWCRANPSSSCYTWKYKGGGGTELTFE